MTLAEAIYRRSLRLPEQAAREALDFIEFLEQRYGDAEAAAEATPDDAGRRGALEQLERIRIDWGGKPIASRDALYDQTRGTS